MSESTEQFFDRLGEGYGGAIARCAPRYAEMLAAIIHYLPTGFRPRSILELGCGDGNLSQLIAAAFPHAYLHLVDLSQSLLAQCQQRLAAREGVTFQQADFVEVSYSPGSFDLVVSSIAIHHVDHSAKAMLFGNMFEWLAPGGYLSYSDQFSAVNADAYRKHIDAWHTAAIELGSSEADWKSWMQHQAEHDHHATLVQQIDWLRAAGFEHVDCPWRYLLWTVLQARRPVEWESQSAKNASARRPIKSE